MCKGDLVGSGVYLTANFQVAHILQMSQYTT